MRIEVVCASRELFGSDRSAVRLARLLKDLGHDAFLSLPRARPERGLAAFAGDNDIATQPAPIVVLSSRGVTDPMAIFARPPGNADLTIHNSAAAAIRRSNSASRILVLREWVSPRSRRHRALCSLHARRVDAVVAVSNGVAAGWRSCAGTGGSVEVCPNWLGDEWLDPADGAEPREGVLFLGRLNAWKGHRMLADAFERAFAKTSARPSLTFVGAEPDGSRFASEAADFAARCDARGWKLVRFVDDPKAFTQRAALVVVPSLRPEPFGNVILEALASGARVIAFPGGGVDDLAPLFPGPLQVVDRDLDALARAIEGWWKAGATAQSPDERRNTMATLEQRFTAAAVAPFWSSIVAGFES